MTEKITVPNSKGQKLAAVVHRPDAATDKLAILCPGYADSQDYMGLVGLAIELCTHGYTAVRFNPTGTWESEGDISEYNTTQYLADVKSVLEYMLAQKNYTHILTGGHSRGARIAVLYAARDERVSAVVSIMPSHSSTGRRYEKWRENGQDVTLRDMPDNREVKIEFRVPHSFVEDSDKYPVLEDIKNVHAPVILVAGALDTTNTPAIVKEIFDRANEPKKFIIVPGIGHNYRHNPKEVEQVNEFVLQGLEELHAL